MTKQVYKNISYLLIVFTFAVFTLPFNVSARGDATSTNEYKEEAREKAKKAEENKLRMEQERKEKSQQREGEREEKQQISCERFLQFVNQNNESFNKEQKKGIKERGNKNGELENHFNENKKELERKREESNQNREKHFESLSKRAETEEQKTAVESFKSAVLEAIEKRQTAIDSAQEQFKTAVKTLIEQRKSSIDNLAETYKSTIEAIAEKAKSDCESGMEISVVKTEMQSAIKSARELMSSTKKNTDSSNEIRTLVETRNASIKSAADEFRGSLQSEIEKLKNVFNEE